MTKKYIQKRYHLMVIVMVLLLPLSSLTNFSAITPVTAGANLKTVGTLTGSNPGENFGWNVTGVGDVNGDGFDDILVGAPHKDVIPNTWWNEDWTLRKRLSFDNSARSEILFNFPVLITLNQTNFDFSKAKADGSDIRFVDSDDLTQLNFHIEIWNPAGDCIMWVNVTEIQGGSNTDFIWMYYGNPAAYSNQDIQGTFDGNYVGVWHLNETSGTHNDATSNNNDGTPQGDINQNAVGKIDGADDFDGVSDYINCGSSPSLDLTSQITLEAWVKPRNINHPGTNLNVIHKYANSDRSYVLFLSDDGADNDDWDLKLSSSGTSTTVNVHASNAVDNDKWQYMVGTWDGSTVILYKNAAVVGTPAAFAGPIHVSATELWIGHGTYYDSMEGWIDEVRISNIARSADWISASYQSMNSDFVTYHPEDESNWWNANWKFRKSLVFDNLGQLETLKDFPVLVTLNPSNFNYSKAKSDGTDLRFVEGTQDLTYHIENWNASGESHIWVRVNSIDADSASDFIMMYYGNPSAVSILDPSGTYDNNYMGVWHLNETAGPPLDATSYQNHGTIYNNVWMDVPGIIDGAADFEGDTADDDYIDCGNDPSLEFDVSNDYTWSAWIYRHTSTDWDVIFSKLSWANYGFRVFSNSGGAPNIVVGNHQNELITSVNSISLNTWHHITVVFNSTLPMLPAIYIDGVRQSTVGVATFLSDNTTPFDIGYGFSDEAFDGVIDEVRFSQTARSDYWVKAQYLSQSNNFITFGPEEGVIRDAGAAYLFFGRPDLSTSEISAESANVTIYGSSEDGLFGWSVSPAGNVNGDPYDDFIVGAPGYMNRTGRAYIFYGKDTSSWSSEMTADSDADVILTGENEGDRFGHAVSEVGDVGSENNFVSWMFKRKITMRSSQVTGDLIDFPVMFKTKGRDLVLGARSDGLDIIFTDSDGTTLLDFELESYNSTNGELVAWVKIPFLSSTKDTEFFMYYGNPSSIDYSNPKGVWDADYRGVWHLAESGSGALNEFQDSSVYRNNGQGGSGAANQIPQRTPGKIGYAQIFDGIDDHINSAYDASLDIGGNQITLEAWINYSGYNPSNYMGIMSHDGWNEGYRLVIRDTGDPLYFHLPEDASWVGATQDTPTSSWTHVVGVYNGSSMRIYINGVADTSSQSKTNNIETCPNEFWIGHGDNVAGQSYSYPWDGTIDEVRISSTARSADWIMTQYNNQDDPDAFFLIGAQNIMPSKWFYKKEIVIDSKNVAGDLSDFPVLIKTIDPDLRNHARTDGFDIIFTSSDGTTKLAHEIERYDSLSGELIAWVKVPNMSSTSDNVIYMHYGNPLSFDQQDVQGTWSNGYLGVYHMVEETGDIQNSASANFQGSRVNNPTRTNAQIGYGQEFSGSAANDMFDLGDLGLSDGIKENLTISVWANINDSALDIWSRIINKRDDADLNTLWGVHFDSQPVDKDLVFAAAGDTGAWPIAKSTWVYITMTFDGVLKTHYHDGLFMRDDNGGSGPISIPSSAPVTIGARQGPNQGFGGILDEMRISFVSRPAEWIKTQYSNQKDPLSFCKFGHEEILVENWEYYKPMKINSTMVPEDLFDFPVLIDITDPDLKEKARIDGYDIVFAGSNGKPRFDHEIEYYDNSTGRLLAWVRIPFLSSIEDTKVFMHYGNPAIDSPQNEEGVWKNGYVAVYHMNQDAGSILNSASAANDGARINTPTRTQGKIGYSQDFTGAGTDDHFNLGDLGLADGVNENITMSFWMKVRDSDLEGWAKIISKRNEADSDYVYHISFDDVPSNKQMYGSVNGDGAWPYATVLDDQWMYITMTYNGTDKVFYVNESVQTQDSPSTGAIWSSSADVSIGARFVPSQNYAGGLDELRFSNVVRSQGWVETEYNNQNAPGLFMNFGTEEMYFNGWKFRKPLTIHSSKVTGDLTNFPVLVCITDSDLKNRARSDGHDIVFTSSDGHDRLDHEIENYESATGSLTAWVRIPSLSSSIDTKFFMNYGKSTQQHSLENPEGVWDSNYLAVWHMNEAGDGTADEYDESTINGFDGRGGAGDINKVPTKTFAKIGSGQDFDGFDDFIDLSSMNPQGYGDLTIEAWYRSSGTSTVDDEYIWSHINEYALGPGVVFGVTNDPGYVDSLRMNLYNDTLDFEPYYGTSDIVDQQFHYLTGVRGNGEIKLYVDANQESRVPDNHSSQVIDVDNSSSPNIGDLPGETEQLNGVLDEIRISISPRSWDWINATYNNQNDPISFISVGSGENINGFSDIIVGAPGFSNSKGQAYIFMGSSVLSGEFPAGSADIIFNGSNNGDRFAEVVSGRGNIDSANFDDIIIGAPGASANNGMVHIFYGVDSMPLFIDAVNSDITIVGSGGYEFGSTIAHSMDVNSDGFDDIIVGSPKNNGGTGAAFVFYGDPAMPNSMNILDADVMMFGESPGDGFGYSISGIEDVNGDGLIDLAIGAPYYDEGIKSNCGAIYIFEGGSPMDGIYDWIIRGEDADDHFGWTNSYAGNICLDSINYILTGAPNNDDGGLDSGKGYIITATHKPQISNIAAFPWEQIVGGTINISCDAAAAGGINRVWVNITFPDGNFQNVSMNAETGNSWFFENTYDQVGIYQFVIWANSKLGDWAQSTTFQFNIQNQAPELTAPRVNPALGNIDSSFNFTVVFSDLDDQPPDKIQVNISGRGAFDLMEVDPLDLNYSNGKVYFIQLLGFSIGQHSFNFAANDTSGLWVESGNYVFDVQNRAPTLSSPLVTPDPGYNDDSFNFSVMYIDLDDHGPNKMVVNISGYGTFDLLETDPGDTDFKDGKSYYYVASGFTQDLFTFNFAANDSLGSWVQTPTLQFSVINRAPSLSQENITPRSGYTRDSFNFTVTYFDLDDNAPGTITVNISSMGAFDLFESDISDSDYTDGKEYYFNTSLTYGSYSFHFAASDVLGLWAKETTEISYPTVSPRPGVLDIQDYTIEYGDSIYLNATLTDNLGNPIINENVSFFIDFDSDGTSAPQELIGTKASSPTGEISVIYPGVISRGIFNYSAGYFGSGDYIVTNDYASIIVLPKPATLTAPIIAVEAGTLAFLNSSLTDSGGNPVVNEFVKLYLDKSGNGDYEGSELIVLMPTSVSGLASIQYQINLAPDNYGFWAKYEGSANYDVTEIKGLISVMSTGNIPPTIQGRVPDQIKAEDCPPWTLDLTPYEDDIEDSGIGLKWYLEGVDTSLYSVTGEHSPNDEITFIPEPDAYGNDEVILWLYDSEGSWDSQTLWINITPVNDIPYFDPLPPNLFVHFDDPDDPEDDPNPWDYTFYVHDVESNVEDLVITTSQPTLESKEGYAQVSGLSVTFHYPEKRVGEAIIVFLTISDGENSSQTMITVNVTDDWVPQLSNELPDIVLYENTMLFNVFDLDDFFVDKDNDVIYFSSGYNNIIVHINENHTVDITAPGQWTGTELVSFRARDPQGAIEEDTISVTVLGVNDGPRIFNVPDLVVHYDYSYSFDLSPYIYDPDNETEDLTVWTSEPLGYLNVQASNNLGISISYPESLNGLVIPVTIYVSDGIEMDSIMINISVTNDFPPELIQNLPDVYFNEDSILENAFTLSDYFFDIDSAILYYTNGTKMINVTINNDLSVDFSAPANWSGSELVTFRATDSQGALAEDKILVFVTPVNDPPQISSIPWQERNSGDEWVLDLSGFINDIDNKLSELTIIVHSENGPEYVTLVGQVLMFKYHKKIKNDYITVTVSDGEYEASRGFIVSLKNKRQMSPSIWDLIPWSWVLSTMLVSIITGFAIYRKKTSYKVYEAFLIHEKGLSVAHASENKRSELEEVIVSGMFTAVQDFIGDTFSDKTSEEWELDEMRFGENKILIERSKKLFLAVIFEGNGSRLRARVKKLLGDINSQYGEVFGDWKGEMSQVRNINFLLTGIVSKKLAKKQRSELLSPSDDPEFVEAESEDGLHELDEMIKWSENLSQGIDNITEPGEVQEDLETEKRYECPICGVEVEDGIIFCPACKSRDSPVNKK